MNRKECLYDAIECTKVREGNYGTPKENFDRCAALWSAYRNEAYTAKDVGIMMMLLKIARLVASDHEDSYVDIAGYAAITAEAVYDTQDSLPPLPGQQSTEPTTQD